ncbi:AMP-binding protein [Prescottella agglutinans]|uniref:Acyl-CoA synthetase (AMP-forming)/AMP-acid ligase II n=1 Tax=Prescottella agglutinans TaxID=1644129 RepID=A0ABT6ML20_9NOCA|nr:AMP-binding protein [Prescottella agglutinans]MDH6285019.1 acyl-CoA synthetase (AMP-forming)/AMP-acid ligase II [Prescottella agglutinans]
MTVSADPRFEDQVRAYYEAGYWNPSTLVTAIDHWADEDPDHPYLSDGVSTYSYGEFRSEAWSLAGALSELGVQPGDRVVVQLPNWNEFYLVYAALTRVGAVTVPVVPVYREHEVQFIVENSQAVGLITTGEFRGFDHAAMGARITASAPTVIFHITVRAGSKDDQIDLATLLESEHRTELPAAPSADDPHLILYSSGTESRPKGCLHTWNTAAFLPTQAVPVLGMRRSDVMFVPSPIAHTLGLTLGVMAPTIAGAQAHLLDIFTPAAALERIGEYRCTGTASPAPFIRMLLDAYDPDVHDVSRLRFWLTAGAAIPASLVQEAQDRLSGCRVVSAYGSSEVMMATACRPEDPVERVATSDGAPVPGVELRIVDFDEREAATGTDGEIRYRGPGRMLEYWGRPELTADGQDDEGWWRTGDLGRIDEQGYLRVTGRLKDIIIRGGFNISAREVEEALLLHPAITDAAVVGLPDDAVGERACAVIVGRGDTRLTLDDIRRHLGEEHKLAVWKIPERVEYVEEFPRTATGKIQKFALRNRYGSES